MIRIIRVDTVGEVVTSAQASEQRLNLSERHTTLRVKAQAHARYRFLDEATQQAPTDVYVKQVGNDIYISFGKADAAEPDIVIEGYYQECIGGKTDSTLIAPSGEPLRLADGSFVPMVCAAPVEEKAWLPILGKWAVIGLGALGVNKYLSTNSRREVVPAGPDLSGYVIALTSISEDSGVSGSDFITKDQTLILMGTSDAPTGSKINVIVDGTVVGSTLVQADATWKFDYSSVSLAAGSHTVSGDLVSASSQVAVNGKPHTVIIDVDGSTTQPGGGIDPDSSKALIISGISLDTGVSASDFITQDQTLIFSGTTTASSAAKVAITVDGVFKGYADINAGVWSYNYQSTELVVGVHVLLAQLSDVVGNLMANAVSKNIIIDRDGATVQPGGEGDPLTENTIAIAAISTDSGISTTDFLTNDQTLTISGSSDAAVGSHVDVKVDSVHIGYATVAAGGGWLYDYSGTTLAAGAHTIDAALVDSAGNLAKSAVQKTLIIDIDGGSVQPGGTVDPLVNKNISIAAISIDSGISGSDFITNDQTLIISGSSDAANGSMVEVRIDGLRVAYVTVIAGEWSLDYTGTSIATGIHTIDAALVDAAGNAAKNALQKYLVIDVDGGTVQPGGAVDLMVNNSIAITAISNDSGPLSTDFITNDKTLIITGTSDAASGNYVEVLVDGVHVAYTRVILGVWSYDYTSTLLAVGAHTIDANLVDLSGNIAKSANQKPLIIDVDGGAVQPGGGLDPLTANKITITTISSDSGPSSSDFITNDQTLMIVGVSNAADGSNVDVKVDGVHIGYTTVTAGAWSFDYSGTTLAVGAHTLDAALVDLAGNVAKNATQKPLLIDVDGATTQPGGITDSLASKQISIAAISTDSGVSAIDFITSDQTLIISGSSDADVGSNVAVKIDGVHVGYTTVIAGGVWTYDYSGTGLAAGAHTIDAALVDVAGNAAATATPTPLLIDISGTTTQPGGITDPDNDKVVVISAISADTGISAVDFITQDQTLVFSRTTTASNSAKIAITVDGVFKGYADISAGVWSYDYQATTMAAGAHVLLAQLADIAGNLMGSPVSQSITIDNSGTTTQPGGVVDPNASLAAVSIIAITVDSGVLATDFITNDSQLIYSGALSGFDGSVGDLVYLELKSSSGALVASQYVTPVAGTWMWDQQATIQADGSYTLTARIMDAAGNQVGGSTATQSIVIDTSATTTPNPDPTPDPLTSNVIVIAAITSDSGVSGTDFITNDQTLIISGTSDASNGSNVDVKVDGAHIGYATVTAGAWSFDYSGTTLAAGAHTIDAALVDLAGNAVKSATQTPLIIDIDGGTVQPGGGVDALVNNVIAIAAITSDSGVSGTDFMTNDQTLVIGGTSDAANGSHVDVKVDGAHIGYATVTAGVWSFDYSGTTLAVGAHTIDAALVDVAGNIAKSAAQKPLIIDIDGGTVSPGGGPDPLAASKIVIYAISSDSGPSSSDFITNDQTLMIAGASDAADGSNVEVQVDGVHIGYTTVMAGEWSFDYTGTVLAQGQYVLGAALVDVEGNIAVSASSKLLMIDTSTTTTPNPNPTDPDPAAGKVIAISAISSDSGFSATDFITNDNASDGGLTFTGSSDAADGTYVAVKLGTMVLGYTTVVAGGWTYTHTSMIADGSYVLNADLEDAAGNIISHSSQALVIDASITTTPSPNPTDPDPLVGKTISIVNINDDAGVFDTDFNTSDQALIFKGSSNAAVGSHVQLLLNGLHIGYTIVDATGNWLFDYTGTVLAQGQYVLGAALVDVAGNQVANAIQRPLIIDFSGTTTPNPNPTDPDPLATKMIAIIAITDDSGLSATDFITTDQTLFINGTSDAADGSHVGVKLDGVLLGYATVMAGAWSYDNSGMTLAFGNYILNAGLVDLAGNVATAAMSQALTISASTLPVQTTTIDSYTDNAGSLQSNYGSATKTDDIAPVLNGSLSAAISVNDVVRVYDGVVLLGTANLNAARTAWAYAPSDLLDGSIHSYRAVVTSALAVEGTASAVFSLTVDTTAPTLGLSTIASDDVIAGADAVFNVLERAAVVADTGSFTISGITVGVEDDQKVTLIINSLSYININVASSAWTFNLPKADALALNHGSLYDVKVLVSDAAGNPAINDIEQVYINIAPPDIPTVQSQRTADVTPILTGLSKKDNAGTYISLENGDLLEVILNAVTYTLNIGAGPISTNGDISYDASTSIWTLNVTTALSVGMTYEVGVAVTAGGITKNDISSNELVIVPPPAVSITVVAVDDTINSAEKAAGISINGTTINTSAGDVVAVRLPDLTLLGTTTVNVAGAWFLNVAAANLTSLTDAAALTLTARVDDSYSQFATDTHNVMVDLISPILSISQVTGDDIINVVEHGAGFVISGSTSAEDGRTVSVLLNAKTYTVAANAGAWSVNVPAADALLLSAGSALLVTVSVSDAAGNPASASRTLTVDITAPGVSISTSDSVLDVLDVDDVAVLTFTLTEASSTFALGDIVATGGSLSNFTALSATVYSADFTPTAGLETVANIDVAAGTFIDAGGNNNTAAMQLGMIVDTLRPTIAINSDKTALIVGETAIITFTFSEDPGISFVNADVALVGGGLGAITGTGLTRSAIFTPANNSTLAASISVASATFADAVGNGNVDGADVNNTVSMIVNTVAPTLAITSDMTALRAGQTAAITFTFSEDPGSSFTNSDVVLVGGSLSVIAGNGLTRTATFTPSINSTTTANISVASDAFNNVVGNVNADGSDLNNAVIMSVDTLPPTIAISSDKTVLLAGQTATLTFTFSEDPGTSFSNIDVLFSLASGSLGAISGSGLTRTAIFTPTVDSTITATISVTSSSFTDAAGNANVDAADADNSLSITVDTLRPTIAITSDKAALSVGQTATITFTFSEDPGTSFINSDVTLAGGSLSMITGSGLTRTAVFTPTFNSTTTASIGIASGVFLDAAGNPNADGADTNNTVTMTVDTAPPTQTATITNYTDNVVPNAGNYGTGTYTNDAFLDINGTLDVAIAAGDKLNLYDGGILIASLTGISGTSWSYSTAALSDGSTHTYTAKVVDSAGNEGGVSNTFILMVDQSASTMTPVITSIRDNAGTADIGVAHNGYTTDTSPGLVGTLTTTLAANEVLDVYRDGALLGAATVTATAWTYADTGVSAGVHNFTLQVRDAAGNVGALTSAYTITEGVPTFSVSNLGASTYAKYLNAVYSYMSTDNQLVYAPSTTNFGANMKVGSAIAGIVTGVTSNDDDDFGTVSMTSAFGASGVNVFGTSYTQVYVGTNGYLTFGAGRSDFTPLGIPGYDGSTSGPIMAAFFSDLYLGTSKGQGVSPGGHSTPEGAGTQGGMYAFADTTNASMTFTWDDVGAYSSAGNTTVGNDFTKGNAFQIRLHKLSSGEMVMEFVYENISWAGGGSVDASATAGWSKGNLPSPTYGELTGSGVGTSMLSLESNSNVGIAGVYRWVVDSTGQISSGTTPMIDKHGSVVTQLAAQLAGVSVNGSTAVTTFALQAGSDSRFSLVNGSQIQANAGALFTAAETSITLNVIETEPVNGATFIHPVTIQLFDSFASGAYTTTISSLTDDVAPVTGVVANNGTTDDTNLLVSGTVSQVLNSDWRVHVLRDGVDVGNATVTAINWTFQDSGASNAAHVYTAVIEDNNGNKATTSANYTVTIAAADTIAPTVISSYVNNGPASGSFTTSTSIDFTAGFSEAVMVSGSPTLTFTLGSTSRNASYVSGSGSSTLLFRYTVVAEDLDANGIEIITDAIASGTITDAAGNLANRSFVATGTIGNAMVNAASPLVLDLNGDGVHTLSVAVGVKFDLLVSGEKQTLGWIDHNDGLLVLDLNHDGEINDGRELFGTSTLLANGNTAADGFVALAQYDSNNDAVINNNDAVFAQLNVWRDANSNGQTDAGELRSLADFGVAALQLSSTVQDVTENGNWVGLLSGYATNDGQYFDLADVWFTLRDFALANTAIINSGSNVLSLSDVLSSSTSTNIWSASNTTAGSTQLDVVEPYVQRLINGEAGSTLTINDFGGVMADAADVLALQWQHGSAGTVNYNGHSYSVYNSLGDQHVQLLIDCTVAVNFG